MRIFKIIGVLVAVMAFSAIGVASASAAETLWQWLPGTEKETFTGEAVSGALLKLQEKGGATVECKAATILLEKSELLDGTGGKDSTLLLVIIHFTGCKALGFAANSEGDASGVILVHLEVHNCLISPTVHGLLIEPLPLTLELSLSKKKIINVKGSFVAEIEKTGTSLFHIIAKQAGGVQAVEKCEGGNKETLLSELISTAKAVEAGEEATVDIHFDKTFDSSETFS